MYYRTEPFRIITALILLAAVIDSHILSKINFRSSPFILIANNKANILFDVTGPVTHIKIKNCVLGTKICLTENVTVPFDREDNETAKSRNFLAEVPLAFPEAELRSFFFWNYAGQRLLNPEPKKVIISTLPCWQKVMHASLVTSFVSGMVLTVSVTLALEIRLGRHNTVKRKERKSVKPSRVSLGVYESDNMNGTLSSSTALELSPPAEISYCHSISQSQITFESLLSDGHFYQVWRGKLECAKNLSQSVVIKKDKGCNEGYVRYLVGQGENLMKLKTNGYFIYCFGSTPDFKLLIMEVATMGNLKQYLRARANGGSDMKHSPSCAMNFINQIFQGVEAVHRLNPSCLFYCLCASNVLLSGSVKCKLSGFAYSSIVRRREEWEEKNNLPRPFPWLSPEAIRLEHTTKSDVWSFGVLMWEIFTEGKEPFGEYSSYEIRHKILNGHKLFKPVKCSSKMYDVMLCCWMHEPSNRPLLNDISRKLLAVNR